MKHLDLFSGIGGFALATEQVWPDIEHVFCDNEPFAQLVLKKHWPHAKIYSDIRTLTYTSFCDDRGITREFSQENELETEERQEEWSAESRSTNIDLLTGGFPCQPFSQAGRRKGTSDNRFLWPEMLRVIREFRPRWVVGENVAGLLTIEQGVVFEQVCADLEGEGYEVQSFVIPAVALNAPHRRDRVWIVAKSNRDREVGERRNGSSHNEERDRSEKIQERENQFIGIEQSGGENAPDTEREGHAGKKYKTRQSSRHSGRTQSPDWSANWLEVATHLCRVDDGISRRMDRNPRLKALGNAIVPAVATEIFKAIKAVDA